MTLRSKLDVDLICHDSGTATFVVNSLSDHFLIEPNVMQYTGAATVGTSGRAGERVSPVSARMRSLPALEAATMPEMPATTPSICPPSTSANAGPPPL